MMRRIGFVLLALVLAPPAASAAAAGGLAVQDAWIRVLLKTLPAAGYFTLHNGTDRPVRLVGAQAPDFGKVMLHQSVEKGGQEKMVHVDGVDVPPGQDLSFAPGGYHIMLMQAKRQLHPGDKEPVTLIFADGGRLEVDFTARGPSGQ